MPIPCTIERHGSRPGRILVQVLLEQLGLGRRPGLEGRLDRCVGSGAAFVRGHQELTILR